MTRKLAFAVLASVMLAACQKTDPAKSPESLVTKTPAAMIIAAKDFFKNNIATIQSGSASSNTGAFSRQETNKTPLWEKAYITHDNTKGDVVVVPLQYEKPLYFKTNFGNGNALSIENQSQLWIYTDVSGKYKAEVRILLPDKTYQDGSSKSFAGYLLQEDWTGNSIGTYLYKNGKASLLKKNPLPLNGNNTANREGNICFVVNWYQCDYIGNGVGYNCQLLYSEYIPCDSDEDDEEGGGGGGGGVDSGNQCATQCVNDFNALINGTSVVSETVDLHVSDINGSTKNKNPEWRILKNLTWALFSHETGTIEHVTYPYNRWEWRTLTHHSITFAGATFGGSVSFSQGVGTPSFTPGTPNVLIAGMDLSFTVTYSPLCNCPGINVYLPPTTIPYTANAFWNANPI